MGPDAVLRLLVLQGLELLLDGAEALVLLVPCLELDQQPQDAPGGLEPDALRLRRGRELAELGDGGPGCLVQRPDGLVRGLSPDLPDAGLQPRVRGPTLHR